MDKATQVQILDEADCINTLGKATDPVTLPQQAMGKIVGQTGLFSLG